MMFSEAATNAASFAGRPSAGKIGESATAKPGEEYCVVNIGPRERRRRLLFGVFAIGAGLIMAAVMVALHVSPLWRLLLFLPFSGGATGYFQARDKT